MPFRVGDLTALGDPDAAWAGAVALYSLIHVPRAGLGAALGEVRRVLRRDAYAAVEVDTRRGYVVARAA